MSDNVLIDAIPGKMAEWKTRVSAIEAEHASSKDGSHRLRPGEDQAFYGLRDYWKYEDFDASRCRIMLDEIKKNTKFHPGGWSDMLIFQRICTEYYTKDKDAFIAFQKAMGGKQRRQQDMQQQQPRRQPQPQQQQQTPRQQQTQPQQQRQQQAQQHQPPRPAVPAGQQRLEYSDGYYIGEVKNGAPNGRGKYFFTNGDYCEGMFINGQFTDKNGVIYARQNSRYDRGEFVNYVRMGRGRMEWADGNRYEGTWDDSGENGLNGRGIFYYADGRKERCKYVNGEYVSTGMVFDTAALSGIGAKVWDSIPYWPWGVLAIYVVVTLFKDGFWSAVLVAVIGAIGAWLLQWVLSLSMAILEGIRNWFIRWPKWMKIAFWIIMAVFVIKNVFPSLTGVFTGDARPSAQESIVSTLNGTWTGTFNGKTTILEFTGGEGGMNVSLRIGSTVKELKGDVQHWPDLSLAPINEGGDYSGAWSGVVGGGVFEGTYTNPQTGSTLPFKFEKQ